VSKGDYKRKKLNLEEYVKKFKEVLREDTSKIKYYRLEKCKIVTEEGKKVFKRGQMMPQVLIKDTVKHLKDLEKREIKIGVEKTIWGTKKTKWKY
ncbi:pol polyprotein, partial [Vairimorpha ceranae]